MRNIVPSAFFLIVAAAACSSQKQTTVPPPAPAAEVPATEVPQEPLTLELPFPVPAVDYAEPVVALRPDTLVVTKDAILFAQLPLRSMGSKHIGRDDFETLVELEDGQVPANLKKGGAKGLFITPLVERLQTPARPSSGERGLTLLLAPETTYRLLVEVLYSSGQARISEFDFVVESNGLPGVVRATAPKLQMSERCDDEVVCSGTTVVVKDGTSIIIGDRVPLCRNPDEQSAAEFVRVDTGQCIQPRVEPGVVGQVASHTGTACAEAAVVADAKTPVGEVLAAAGAVSLAPETRAVWLSLPSGVLTHQCDAETWTPEELPPNDSAGYLDHRRRSAEAVCDWYVSCDDEELVFSLTSQLQRLSRQSSLAWGELFDTAVRRGNGTLSRSDCTTFFYDVSAVQGHRIEAQIEAGFAKFNTRNSIACQEQSVAAFPTCEARSLAFDPLAGLTDPSLAGRREEVFLRTRARIEMLDPPAICDAVLSGTVPAGSACSLGYECQGDAVCAEGLCSETGG